MTIAPVPVRLGREGLGILLQPVLPVGAGDGVRQGRARPGPASLTPAPPRV